ncbi:prolactin-8A9-like isoform X2 [Apodemus sylvaticus]|uniref:prolactin-8A9-like isoform X2 n=1 Tax=Apodemus sylvaticus TaxID=10129 RepID=UPI002243F17D|nr:prolactin-8A9-like isoform X2 [Apodemus sylvaticus]
MLPLSQPHFRALLLVVMSNLLLWEKTASVPACIKIDGECWDPIVDTFNGALDKAEVIRILAEQMNQEFYRSPFSSKQFAALLSRMYKNDQEVVRARKYCHSNVTNPPNYGPEFENIKTKDYLETLINFVSSWVTPLYFLVEELSAMKGVPGTMFSNAQVIEAKNLQILDDLRWILTKVDPPGKMWEKSIIWEYLPGLRSKYKSKKFLAMFNLSNCLRNDIFYIKFHLRTLKCRITGKDC